MLRLIASVVILGCSLSLAAAGSIEPKLEHTSSKKFFGKDYPRDERPSAKKLHFGHPYPAVQDAGDFDRDFVKDQNEDGGKWAAQMEYDILRKKVRQAEKELKILKKKLDEEKADMEKVRVAWRASVDKVTEARKAVAKAQQVEDAAKSKVNAAKSDVNAGAAKVEKEMKDLEECKKALADAKQKLKDALEKQEAMEKKAEEAKAAAEKAKQEKEAAELKAKKEKEEAEHKRTEEDKKKKEEVAKKKVDAANKRASEETLKEWKKYEEKIDAAHKAEYAAKGSIHDNKVRQSEIDKKTKAEAKARQAEIDKQTADIARDLANVAKAEATWNKKIAQEQAEYSVAEKDYDAKLKAMQDTEAALEMARANLKKFRRAPHVDQDGGVYNVPRNSASSWRLSALVGAAFVGLLAC